MDVNIAFIILVVSLMTVHKELGIAIQKRNKGQSNRTIDHDEEDYTVNINIKKLTELHYNWNLWMS